MTELWWAPRDIRFTREQVVWLLGWLPSMREGNWLAEPRGSGYTDAPGGKKTRSRHAAYETPCQVAAELDARLARCGLDRYLVEDCYTYGVDERELAGKLGLDVEDIGQRIGAALKYVSGWRRKQCSLREWRGHRRVEIM